MMLIRYLIRILKSHSDSVIQTGDLNQWQGQSILMIQSQDFQLIVVDTDKMVVDTKTFQCQQFLNCQDRINLSCQDRRYFSCQDWKYFSCQSCGLSAS